MKCVFLVGADVAIEKTKGELGDDTRSNGWENLRRSDKMPGRIVTGRISIQSVLGFRCSLVGGHFTLEKAAKNFNPVA